jgi:2-C-methyl-D-erythritol 4-phosphate cytidylyltransferase
MKVGALLLCGGSGRRLGAGTEKPLVPLAGRPLFAWSLEALERCQQVDGVVVVGLAGKLDHMMIECGFAPLKVVQWVEGGATRRESVARGLAALPQEFDMVAIHDCARALATTALIGRVVNEAINVGAAIAAVPLEDTLKRAALKRIDATVPRANLWRAQTPQVFRRHWIEAAHAGFKGEATDDAMMVEASGQKVYIAEGDPMNIKITTPRDLALAEVWLGARVEA